MINARKKRKRTGNDAQIMLGMRFGMHILYTWCYYMGVGALNIAQIFKLTSTFLCLMVKCF